MASILALQLIFMDVFISRWQKILAKKLEEFDPMFIEEPVLCENMEVI